ncbi:hypothetical protein F5B17DRAFT_426819 [Nemania serpens]|nr:hypothetical protein F5B17DRAFT_426819 [Nemania serpens]
MLLSTFAFIAVSLSLAAEGASINEHPEFVKLHEYISKDGVSTITIYGDALQSNFSTELDGPHVEAARDLGIKRRCGSQSLICDNSHTADRNSCKSLIDDLRGDSAVLGSSPRSICGTYNNQQCCVSWHTVVTGATRDSLVSAAQKSYDGCKGDTGVSAKVSDTMIGATCTDQCMSNRATHC